MTVIGDAYIDVKSKTDGVESSVESVFGSAGAKAAIAFTAAFAAAGAVTKVLYDIGEAFDKGNDRIRVSTGQTGAALGALEKSAKTVFASVPESYGTVSAALSTINQKLGLTGKPLESLTKQFLDLSHITGTDVAVNVKSITDLFNNFGVAAGDQGPKLDELFRATQVSGLGISDLATQMAGAGVQLRALGLSFDDSTALIAGLAKQGLSVSDVLPALSKTMAVAAKSGKDASTVFKDLFSSIKNAPTDTAAAGIAFDALGAKAGPRLAGLIREGKLSFEDLQKSIAGGKDTISQATKDTEDFSEKFDIFKNRVLLDLEPIATRVFKALGEGMDRVSAWWDKNGPAVIAGFDDLKTKLADAFNAALPVIQTVVSWLGDHLQPILIGLGAAVLVAAGPLAILAAGAVYAYTQFEGFRETIDKIVAWLTSTVGPAIGAFASHVASSFGDLVRWTQQHWGEIHEAISHVVTVIEGIVRGVIAVVSKAWDLFGDDLVHLVTETWRFIRETVENGVKFVQGIIQTVLAVINGDWGKAWDGLKQAAAAVWDQIKNIIRNGIETAKTVIGAAMSGLGALFSAGWDALKMIAVAAWNGLWDWVKGGGLLGVVSFFTSLPAKIIGWLGDLSGKLVDAGIELMKGLAKGLLDGAKGAVKSALSTVTDLIPDWKGPLSKDRTLLVPTGKAIMGGLLDGIKSGSDDVKAYLQAFTQNIVSGAQQVSSGIRAAWGVRDARTAVSDARTTRDDLLARQALLPGLITKQLDAVAKAKAAALAIDPAEKLRIDRAQQDIIDKTKALNDARADGQHSALELQIMTDELTIAQQDLTTAQKEATGPTDELTTAEAKLHDLREEQQGMAAALTKANQDLESATLSLVDAQASLTSSSAALAGNTQLLQFFKDIAEQAGLSSGAIQQLISDLSGVNNATTPGPTPGAVPGQRPRLINSVTGRPAFTGPNGEGGSAGPRHVAGETSWIMPDGVRAFYVPGKDIDPGNLGALNAASSSSGGTSPGGSQGPNSAGGWNLAAGTGPGGITFTPGGGGLSIAQLQAIFGSVSAMHPTVLAPVNFNSIDTKDLLQRMNVKAAVGEAVTSATRLRPITP